MVWSGGCRPDAMVAREHYASAEQVEENFSGREFVLGDNDRVALVRPTNWADNHFLRLPFWLGMDVPVPGVLQPREGQYYVISEAELVRRLPDNGQWLIEAGSSLIKKDAILIVTRTHFHGMGRILPMIVQYRGVRVLELKGATGARVPVLAEVSLPMKWTLPGVTPKVYAPFDTGP